MSATKQTVVVTGGSAGIGEEICRAALVEGYRVVSVARRAPTLSHTDLHFIQADLADKTDTDRAAREAASQFAFTHLVHNAGVIKPALIEDVKAADLDYLTNLHLYAAVAFVQAGLPAMKAARNGRIVNISSRGALGLATRTAYAATKAGMIGMTRTWALELGPFGITANVVAPGPIVTDMFHEIVPKDSPRQEALAGSIPVKRLGTAEDVAHAVIFMLSPKSGFVTGQTLYVCGGASVGSIVI